MPSNSLVTCILDYTSLGLTVAVVLELDVSTQTRILHHAGHSKSKRLILGQLQSVQPQVYQYPMCI